MDTYEVAGHELPFKGFDLEQINASLLIDRVRRQGYIYIRRFNKSEKVDEQNIGYCINLKTGCQEVIVRYRLYLPDGKSYDIDNYYGIHNYKREWAFREEDLWNSTTR